MTRGGDGSDVRRAILARRAHFVAVALAGAGLGALEGCDKPPFVCLSPVHTDPGRVTSPPDAGAPLSDAGIADAGSGSPDAGTAAVDGEEDGGLPAPCLSASRPHVLSEPVGKPTPKVCLLMRVDKKDE